MDALRMHCICQRLFFVAFHCGRERLTSAAMIAARRPGVHSGIPAFRNASVNRPRRPGPTTVETRRPGAISSTRFIARFAFSRSPANALPTATAIAASGAFG